jgi:hypothetical protein
MPTSVYFDTGTIPEQRLYEDLIIEQLRAFGQEVFYLPRTLVNEDTIFGEDPLSEFNDAYLIEMYVENIEGYDGEKELMTKFGLDIQNEVTFVVARRRWEQLISLDQNLIVNTRPNEGDLVYFPRTKHIFEISFVDHDDPFYQVQNLPVYKLKCRSFDYSSEQIDTGIVEIDNIETTYSLDVLSYQLTLEDGTGSVLQEGDGTNYLLNEDFTIEIKDTKAQNDIFDTFNNTVLDFSESNPFGDIT